MKRLLSLFLTITLFLSMSGCRNADHGTVSFYYSRDPELYLYFEEDGVIQAEQRELTGHRNDLRYMIGLYLAGPLEEGLSMPFTKATRLISVENINQTISIELTDHSTLMTDAEFALACACLTLTCMDFTPCSSVTIISGERTVTMNADSILLSDAMPQPETTGG